MELHDQTTLLIRCKTCFVTSPYDHRHVYTWPSFHHERHQTLLFFQRVISMLQEKRRRGIPLVDRSLRHRRTSAYIKDIEDLRDFLIRLQEHDDYGAGGSHPRLPHPAEPLYKYALLQGMAQAFRAYGPSKFPQAATYDALVAILTPLGIDNEQGQPYTPDAIKQLLRRRPTRPNIEDGNN